MPSETTKRINALLARVPLGRVTSYGAVAAMAGLPNGARQVVRALHACAESQNLPWHRVLRKDGSIALPRGGGFELQKALLEAEGVKVSSLGRVDLSLFGWGTDPLIPSGTQSGRRRADSRGRRDSPRIRAGGTRNR